MYLKIPVFWGGTKIEIQNLSKNVLLLTLHQDRPWRDNLTLTTIVDEVVLNNDAHDIIIDFSCIEIATSLTIGKLITLQKLQHERGHRLILCNVSFFSKCVFSITGLKSVFDFADNKFTALAAIKRAD